MMEKMTINYFGDSKNDGKKNWNKFG